MCAFSKEQKPCVFSEFVFLSFFFVFKLYLTLKLCCFIDSKLKIRFNKQMNERNKKYYYTNNLR